MKKILTITILAALVFTACKKDKAPENTPNDSKKYEVKFNATGFSQEFTDVDPSSVTKGLKINAILDTTTDAIRLNIFDSQEKEVYKGATSVYGGNLGQFSVILPQGNYKAVFTGMKETYYSEGRFSYNLIVDLESDGNYYYVYQLDTEFGPMQLSKDIFFKEVNFSVPQNNQTQNVTLQRITSRLRVNIKDYVPTAVTRIDVGIDSTYNKFSNSPEVYHELVSSGGSFGIAQNKRNDITADVQMLVPPNSTHTVSIRAYSGSTLYAQKIITGVVCSPNKITLVRGNLFGGATGPSGNNVKVDTAWSSTVINKSF
ncbi:FimB/Mfa2 family fimbrial subunit [Mucilaginibacter roseus]|uniref:FimB/Mfa2 family fimbrial subunit n=1 Tax=Mucilaginibacter roseus TaxID=1528868 RepID=A0ABS8TX98_9SPHI|nr:FimB/Mfa2 family fimbrial subunit [Mucilaginibacter roseus]MCD8739461.1 FimB/Mfa2 family fimbrial subunit [Mucilaginibacter roseus]